MLKKKMAEPYLSPKDWCEATLYSAQHIIMPAHYEEWREKGFPDLKIMQLRYTFECTKAFAFIKPEPTKQDLDSWTCIEETDDYYKLNCPYPGKYSKYRPLCYEIYMFKNVPGYITKERSCHNPSLTVWCEWRGRTHITYMFNITEEHSGMSDEEIVNWLLDEQKRLTVIAAISNHAS